MKKLFLFFVFMLFSIIQINFHAAEKDKDGCKDHPLIPRMPEYYILDCNDTPAESDVDIIRGDTTESVHLEGKSSVYLYKPQPDAKTKLSDTQLISDFGKALEKMNGTYFGLTFGQKWPVYTLEKDGKKYWIILLVNTGEYFTGSYACRIIEND